MTDLSNLSSSLLRTIAWELAVFQKEYAVALQERKSMSALKIVKKELEQIWSKILQKYDAILESPLLDDPEEKKKINIAEIQEKVFKGDYSSWASFRDMFTAVYGKNSRLSEVEKLFYLKQKTHDEPREIVDNAPLINKGYALAWEELCSRYENVRMQVNAQIKIMLDFPQVSTQCGAAVRKLQRTINGCINHLRTLHVATDHWDPILVYLCSSKLPVPTLTKFEETLADPAALPTWLEMDAFLTNTYKGLESVADVKNANATHKPLEEMGGQNERKGKTFHVNVTQSNQRDMRSKAKQTNISQKPTTSTQSDSINEQTGPTCKFCEASHTIRECPQFETLGVNERIEFIQNNGCCYNCLAISHSFRNCRSPFKCRHCGRRHHTLLHKPASTSNTQLSAQDVQPSTTSGITSQTFSTMTQSESQLDDRKKLLGTAVFKVDLHGSLFSARALIDPASDFSFISEALRRRLHLPTTPIIAEISGLNEVVSARSDKLCEVVLRSNTRQDFSLKVQAIVVKTLTRTLPTQSITPPIIKDLGNIKLADPQFYQSRPIDFIIGSDFYPQILRSGVKRNILNSLVAQDTEFGWILTGPVDERHITRTVVSYFSSVALDKSITRFWEIEEYPKTPIKSVEDTICEQIYRQTTLKLPNGRYQVSLPFRTPQIELGNSRHIAMAQFLRNERNLMKKPDLKKEYDNVLKEYIDLGHMTPIYYHPNVSPSSSYYLPHHAVVKPERTTTKVRVVFNASSKSSNGHSLNDTLYTGPILQRDLVVLISQWRFFKIVFNADIQKMYRQILLDPLHTPYQRILYRKNVNEPIQDYELKTVTFGVNSAPYLAIRSLHHLANDVKLTHPLASHILQHSMYVDDVLAGAHTISDARAAQSELISVLESAGFPLRKWIANTTELISHLPKDHLLNADLLTLPELSNAKTLGIRWNAKSDLFFFDVPLIERTNVYTKRAVLSNIARLFDPAGWLAPVIVAAKIIMQQIWQDNTNWDDCLRPLTLHKWHTFLNGYDDISNIEIPRWIQFIPKAKIEFHGFSDASEKAYSAVLYVRVIPADGPISVTLLFAKTRVAPIKIISLPKLELCGAALLASVVHNLLSQLDLPKYNSYFWTDSSIVLAWLSKSPATWNTFVANRVTTILDTVGVENWRHVVSNDNPADVASRGCDPEALKLNSLWWNGPCWLRIDESQWPPQQNFSTQTEAKLIKTFANVVEVHTDILQRFSKFSHALRVVAYVFRFYHHTSPVHRTQHHHSNVELEADEIKLARDKLIIISQRQHFNEEYDCLQRHAKLPGKSSILTLTPFVDSEGIIRANGRLANSNQLTYEERHPVLLPYGSSLANLLVRHVHAVTLHGGNQVMLRVIRSGYWIPKLKNLIRTVVHACTPCIRYTNRQTTQLMAALPPERTQFSRPFSNVGVDFAGPLEIKSYTGKFQTMAPNCKNCRERNSVHSHKGSDKNKGSRPSHHSQQNHSSGKNKSTQKVHKHVGCGICKKDHRLSTCKKFVNMNLTEKNNVVKRLHYCSNCLARNHLLPECWSKSRCHTCNQRHHTSLHGHQRVMNKSSKANSSSSSPISATATPCRSTVSSNVLRTVVPTALIKVQCGRNGKFARAVLNSSTTCTKVALEFAKEHELETYVVDSVTYTKLIFKATVPQYPGFEVHAMVSKELPRKPYNGSLPESLLDKFSRIELADPKFTSNNPVFVELGADLYPAIVKSTLMKAEGGLLIAQDSTLGWLVIGSATS